MASDRPILKVAERTSFGSRTSLLEMIDVLEDIVGHPLEREHQGRRAGDVDHTQADNSRLRELFGGVEAVGLREGLETTVAWYRESLSA